MGAKARKMVNIKDIEVEETPKISTIHDDMLRQIFRRQFSLMQKYHGIEKSNGHRVPAKIPVNLHDRHDQQYLKDFAWRITEEIGEAMNTLKNKPWKQTEMTTDEDHFREELIDGFHFYVELLILTGFTPELLFETYYLKSEVNKFRQRSEY